MAEGKEKLQHKTWLNKQRGKLGYYVTFQQDDVTLVNICALCASALGYLQQMWMDIKGDTDPDTVTMRKSNIPFSSTDRWTAQNINKETAELINAVDHRDLINIYRIVYPIASE